MKRVFIISFYASLYMFTWFLLLRKFRSISGYYDYFGPKSLFAFFGFILIYFLSGHKHCTKFFKGFAVGLISFLIVIFLSFLYTLITPLPLNIQGDIGLLFLPYTPIESVFGLLNSMFKINVSGLTWYIGDVFNGQLDTSLEQVIGLMILLLLVSIVTGLGAIYKKKSKDYNESKNL